LANFQCATLNALNERFDRSSYTANLLVAI
jgi:hypothetical protein